MAFYLLHNYMDFILKGANNFMFESITMNFLTQPKVVAAVDIFRALQTLSLIHI